MRNSWLVLLIFFARCKLFASYFRLLNFLKSQNNILSHFMCDPGSRPIFRFRRQSAHFNKHDPLRISLVVSCFAPASISDNMHFINYAVPCKVWIAFSQLYSSFRTAQKLQFWRKSMFKGRIAHKWENQIWTNFLVYVKQVRANKLMMYKPLMVGSMPTKNICTIQTEARTSLTAADATTSNDICYEFPFSCCMFAQNFQTYIYIAYQSGGVSPKSRRI